MFAVAVGCLVSVVYIRWVNRQRKEVSRYLDLLVKLVTRIGIGQAVLLTFLVYVLLRFFYPDAIPRIGAGLSAIWLGSGILLVGNSPISYARQFHRDRVVGRRRAATEAAETPVDTP